MRKYYAVSLFLFLFLWVCVNIASVILGGATVIPDFFAAIVLLILLNTLLAIVMFAIDIIRGKI